MRTDGLPDYIERDAGGNRTTLFFIPLQDQASAVALFCRLVFFLFVALLQEIDANLVTIDSG